MKIYSKTEKKFIFILLINIAALLFYRNWQAEPKTYMEMQGSQNKPKHFE